MALFHGDKDGSVILYRELDQDSFNVSYLGETEYQIWILYLDPKVLVEKIHMIDLEFRFQKADGVIQAPSLFTREYHFNMNC